MVPTLDTAERAGDSNLQSSMTSLVDDLPVTHAPRCRWLGPRDPQRGGPICVPSTAERADGLDIRTKQVTTYLTKYTR